MTGESAKQTAAKQLKKAEKSAGEYRYTFDGLEGFIKGRQGKPFQGPITINQLNERGVADVLQGQVPQGTMRKLLAMQEKTKHCFLFMRLWLRRVLEWARRVPPETIPLPDMK